MHEDREGMRAYDAPVISGHTVDGPAKSCTTNLGLLKAYLVGGFNLSEKY